MTRSTKLLLAMALGAAVGAAVTLVAIGLDSPTGLSCLSSVGCGWHIGFYVGATVTAALAVRRLPPDEALTGLVAFAITQLLIGFVWASHAGDGDGLAGLWLLFGMIPWLVVISVLGLVRVQQGRIERRR